MAADHRLLKRFPTAQPAGGYWGSEGASCAGTPTQPFSLRRFAMVCHLQWPGLTFPKPATAIFETGH